MSQILGSDFEMINKACHVCDSFDTFERNGGDCNKSVVKGNKGNADKASACGLETKAKSFLAHGNPQQDLKDKGVIDSGCSRHMTRNISYLTDYEEIDGGFVAFGGNSKGGKITGKGKIRTGKLDLKDESINVVPQGGLTCLFAKATSYESNLWHRRLGHVNFKTMNKLKENLPLSFMRPFGCPVTILNTIDHLGKFDGKAHEGFFVGYSTNSKAFRVFNSRTRIVEENLHVQFSENTPNITGSGPNWLFDIDALTNSMNYKPVVVGNQSNGNACTKACDDAGKARVETVPGKDCILLPLWTQDPPFSSYSKESPNVGFKPSGEEEKKDAEDPGIKGSNPSEESERVDQEKDANVNSTNNINTVSPTVNAAGIKDNVIDENIVYGCVDDPNMPNLEEIGRFSDAEDDDSGADINNLDTYFQRSAISYSNKTDDKELKEYGFVSTTLKQGTSHKDLQNCLFACFLSQEEPKKIVQALKDPRTKWVFRNKKDERGIVIKNKARLVAQGYIQEEGIDYDEEVYVCQKPGFEDPDFSDIVYKVEKALYGLHQAPRAWYETLSTYLLDNGFQRGKIDKTLFIRRIKSDILLVQMSSMGELTFFLGLQVKQKNDGIFISQDKYVIEILKKFSFSDVKTASTPMETHKPLLKDIDGEDVDEHLYRSMIGSLMYLTSSRPDIMFTVCVCARFQVNTKVSHLHAVKRIFRYLKGQPKLGLWYPKDSPFDLVAYTDSDYAGASLDRKSTTGGCQFLGCRLISWQCKKQIVVVNSTTDVEYVAASSCCSQVLWIQNQLLDYGDSNEKKLIQMIKIHTNKNVVDLLTKAFDVKRIERVGENKNRKRNQKQTERIKGIGVNAGDSKLMLLGINLLLLGKVNAVRHNLLLFVLKVNAARHNLQLLVNVNAAEDKPTEREGFEQIVDFLNASSIRYALTVNPTIYTSCIQQFWATVKVKTVNGEVQLQALVDGKKIIITESTIRRDLQLEDAEGIDCLPNAAIFEQLTLIGYEKLSQKLTFYKAFFSPQWKFLIHTILQCLSAKTTAWNEFSSTMASVIICLATNQKFNFSKYIFESMVKNSDNEGKFLMYPRFVQMFVNQQAGDMSNHKKIYVTPSHTKKVFGNMKREGKSFSGRVTLLFPTMMKHKPRKPKKKDTQIPQSSVPSDNIAEEAINEENVPTHSNDPLLSGEDRLKLEELMALCTNLQNRVLDLEHTKTTQALEIDSLKRRVKKLKKKQRSRTHGLRRLYKVGLSARVISSEDEGLGEEDVSKQGRKIHDIDADEDITLENVHYEDMFDTDVFNDEEVFAGRDMAETEVSTANPVTTAGEVVTTANVEVSTASPTAATITTVKLTLAQTLAELKSARPKTKGVVMQEPSETTTTIPSKDKGKERIAKEKEEANAALIAQWNDIQNKLFDKAIKRVNTFVDIDTELVGGSEVRAESSEIIAQESSLKRAGDEIEQDRSKKQKLDEKVEAEVDDAKEAEELKQCLEVVLDDGDDVTIDATPLSVKIPIADYKIYQEGKKSFFKIIRADGKTQIFKKTEPVHYMDTFLHLNLKTMFEHHVEDSIWKNQQGLVKVLNWKLFYSCGVHCVTVQTIPYYLLVEKMYPLTKHTLHQMFNNVKLQVDYESEMAYELLRLVKKQLKEGYVPQ
ncbi:putative ribonuclease H-like domain-containing protein [Tanacetum coccineum]